MKLWRIAQSENNNYDTYDSAVVAAETEEDARNTYPGDYDVKWHGTKWLWHLEDGRILDHSAGSWTIPAHVSVEFLSDGYAGKAGVVCASFNAG